jgi:hypothetical protein
MWYGHWRADGAQLKRRIGPKRAAGSRDGLTRTQAEAELRRLIRETVPTRIAAGEALWGSGTSPTSNARAQALDADGGREHPADLARAVLRRPRRGRITADDVHDLMRMIETGARPGPRATGDRRHGRPVGAKSIRNYIGTPSALLGFAEPRLPTCSRARPTDPMGRSSPAARSSICRSVTRRRRSGRTRSSCG